MVSAGSALRRLRGQRVAHLVTEGLPRVDCYMGADRGFLFRLFGFPPVQIGIRTAWPQGQIGVRVIIIIIINSFTKNLLRCLIIFKLAKLTRLTNKVFNY